MCVYIIGAAHGIVAQLRRGLKVWEENHQSKAAIQKYVLSFLRRDLKLISE